MTIYISGPMRGIPEHNYPVFEATYQELKQRGLDVVSPHNLCFHASSDDKSEQGYLRRDLQAMLWCDTILMLPGWEHSKGATLEHLIAKELGFKIHYGLEFLNSFN